MRRGEGVKPKCLDLYCKAGGAARGYQMAGFYVVGVDHEPQPRYAGDEFVLADALEYLARLIETGEVEDYDLIHASPPCQAHTLAQRLQGNGHPDLIAPTRQLLQASGRPYVIENVPGAPLVDPVLLMGSMFGLRTNRPRLFECSFPVAFFLQPPPAPQAKMGRPPRWNGDFVQVVGNFSGVAYAREAMGISWMSRDELREAIPPAYTRYIGEQMARQLLR